MIRPHAVILRNLVLSAALLLPALAVQAADTRLRQVAGILDYVGSDYAAAVDERGNVVSQPEYDEQFNLVREALDLLAESGVPPGDPVVTGLEGLVAMLERRPPPAEVLDACRAIRRNLVERHGLVLEPRTAPDRDRARRLWTSEKCDTCHGVAGGGDGPEGVDLDPPPADFLDPDRVAGVSPHRAFHAITFGVGGTGMAGFDYLPDADRWSLAFHALALRHDALDPAAGREHLERAGWPVAGTPTRLSQLTDDDLRAALAPALPDSAQRELALAWLRVRAPFGSQADRTFALARRTLREGVEAYADGRLEDARSLLISAYLDGVEPHEGALRARDSDLVIEIERGMTRLRALASGRAPVEDVERQAARVEALLDRAEEGRIGGTAAFVGSLAIALREGLEAALLLAALLGILRRRGATRHVRLVHAGWMAAVAAGLVTWFAVGQALSGLGRELAEGVVALAAAVVLVLATHWTLGQATARHWVSFLGRRFSRAVEGTGGAWAVFALAFVAVYREAFEVVLFYRALLMDADSLRGLIVLGAVSGVVLLLAIVMVARRIGQALDARTLFLVSSVLLALLSLVLLGKGVHSLQEAGVVPLTPVGDFAVPSIGLHATTEGLAAQGVLAALLVLSAVWSWLAGRQQAVAAAEPAR